MENDKKAYHFLIFGKKHVILRFKEKISNEVVLPSKLANMPSIPRIFVINKKID